MPFEEAKKAQGGSGQATYYREDVEESKAFRQGYKKRRGVVKAEEMPWEDTPSREDEHEGVCIGDVSAVFGSWGCFREASSHG